MTSIPPQQAATTPGGDVSPGRSRRAATAIRDRAALDAPRLLVGAAWTVIAVSLTLTAIGAFQTGITTDEPIHVMRLRNFFETGWYALDWDYRGDGPGSEGTNTFVYAPAAMLLLHAWAALTGAEGWTEVAATPHAYDMRHLGVALIALAGMAAAAGLGRALSGRWSWGVVAAGALAAMPTWAGHAMFNVKDIPVATGHTLATLGLVLFVRTGEATAAGRWARGAIVTSGLWLTLGTRPGMWTGLFALLVAGLAAIALTAPSRRRLAIRLGELAAACAGAAAALIATYPALFGSPVRALPRTAESSSSFFDGLRSNRLYVPAHVAMEIPTILLCFILTGMAVGLTVVVRRWRAEPVAAGRIALVGVQAAAIPVAAILMGSDLYHGLRQLLFAAPACAVLAMVGMRWWLIRARQKAGQGTGGRVGRGPALVAAAALAALLLPAIDQITLHPYQSAYVNLATDLVSSQVVPAESRPGSDYWRASLPELIEGRALDHQLLCKAMVEEDSQRSFRFVNGGTFSTSRDLDCREEPNGPLAPLRLPVSAGRPGPVYDAAFLRTLPVNCVNRGEVTRWRHGFTVVMTTIGRCTLAPPLLTEDGFTADSPAWGTAQPGDLWLVAADGWESWPGQPALTSPVSRAVLGFALPARCRATGCAVELTGTLPADLRAEVGGSPVDAEVGRAGTVLNLPPVPDGTAWITLARTSGNPLGARITRVALMPGAAPGRSKETAR